jgi:hypothetical protein
MFIPKDGGRRFVISKGSKLTKRRKLHEGRWSAKRKSTNEKKMNVGASSGRT